MLISSKKEKSRIKNNQNPSLKSLPVTLKPLFPARGESEKGEGSIFLCYYSLIPNAFAQDFPATEFAQFSDFQNEGVVVGGKGKLAFT